MLDIVTEAAPPMWYSTHARVRMQQRSISAQEVAIAIHYGEREWSHGLHTFSLTDRALRNSPHAAVADRLRGLCVVMSSDGAVVTVKWMHNLRRACGVLRRRQSHGSRRDRVAEIA